MTMVQKLDTFLSKLVLHTKQERRNYIRWCLFIKARIQYHFQILVLAGFHTKNRKQKMNFQAFDSNK